jgi:hypothetical protein
MRPLAVGSHSLLGTGELSDQAQTGVPMTIGSYDDASYFFGAMMEGRFRLASSRGRM